MVSKMTSRIARLSAEGRLQCERRESVSALGESKHDEQHSTTAKEGDAPPR